MAKEKDKKDGSFIATHHEARHYYEILESIETGIVLVGCEVKSLRAAQCSLAGTFARFEGPDLVVQNLYIAPYLQGNRQNPDSKRLRRLLLHRSQLAKLRERVQERGLALIPLKMYFNNHGIAKLELGVGKSKKLHDQRSDIKKREADRQMDRAVKNRNRK